MNRPSNIDFLILAGPTASGKSNLAIELAQIWDGEIINADSMQVYKDLSIITARPKAEDEIVAHHLYGVLSANESGSAVWWLSKVCLLIEDCLKRNRFPIVVGGTGFYLRALTEGLSPVPDVDPGIRSKVRNLVLEMGENFSEYVYNLDPKLRPVIRATDLQRLARALEVFLQTGQSLLDWQGKMTPSHSYQYEYVVLEPDREHLYDVINKRFHLMIEMGALEEIKKLNTLDILPNSPIKRAIGVPELSAYLKGEMTLEAAIEEAQKNSRRYAKRQITWFKHQPQKKIVIYKADLATLMETFSRNL